MILKRSDKIEFLKEILFYPPVPHYNAVKLTNILKERLGELYNVYDKSNNVLYLPNIKILIRDLNILNVVKLNDNEYKYI